MYIDIYSTSLHVTFIILMLFMLLLMLLISKTFDLKERGNFLVELLIKAMKLLSLYKG